LYEQIKRGKDGRRRVDQNVKVPWWKAKGAKTFRASSPRARTLKVLQLTFTVQDVEKSWQDTSNRKKKELGGFG